MTDMFEWKSPDGIIVRLPQQVRVKAGVLRRVRGMDGVDAIFTLLEAVCDEESLAAVDDLEVGDLNDLITAWQGASLPESSPSST